MVSTLQIELWSAHHAGVSGVWIRVIEIEEDTTLEGLHYVIQELSGFDDDHLYEYFISNEPYSREKVRFNEENEKIYTATISDLYPLNAHKKIFYLFDYGENWIFRIKKLSRKAKARDPAIDYPIVIRSQGENPEQYPEC